MSVGDAWRAEAYDANARFVSDYGHAVVDLLDPQAGERVLDLGCGDGALTEELVARGAEVVGLDASASMVAGARARGSDAQEGDAARLAFEAEFDAVFTNAALHWVLEAEAVAAGVARALKPGGRFVGEFGGHGNVAAILTAFQAALRPQGVDLAAQPAWYFPTETEYARLLEGAGFEVRSIALIPRRTPVKAGMAAWLETLAAPVLARVPEPARAGLRDEVAGLLAPALRDAEGNWFADYVRLRFAARLR